MINNILLIDDREDFYQTFRYEIEAKEWRLLYEKSLKGLKEIMPKLHHKLACVILDIRCLHTDDQEKESPDFIGDAITYLDQNFPKFPRVILTGDHKDFEGFKVYNKSEEVFLKTPQDQKRLIEKLAYYIEHSVRLRIIRENYDAFRVFENGYLDNEKEGELIGLLLALENPKNINIKNNIAQVRLFLEAIYLRINSMSSAYMPDEFFTGDKVNCTYCERYLTGKHVTLHRDKRTFTPKGKLVPDHIEYILIMLKDVTDKAGHHTYKDKVTYNALFTVVFGLMELLVWFNDFMEEKTTY